MEKLVIIGSGPAGLTAAIYAARGGLEPLVISGRQPGGQLMLTTDVDDYPGFSTGIQGPELMNQMRAQAKRFGTRFIDEDVVGTYLHSQPLLVKTETQEVHTQSVIIATGASAKWLGLPSEQKLIGHGVSSCAVCDGFFFKNKIVAVIGGGDTAFREAQYLSKICKEVIIIHRRSEFRAQEALQAVIKSRPNVKFMMDSVVEEFVGEDRLTSLKVKNVKTSEITDLPVDGAFVAIGHKPNVEFLGAQLKTVEGGYIEVEDEVLTSIPGVFVAGDVSDYLYQQAVTASGAGCKAATRAGEYLENRV